MTTKFVPVVCGSDVGAYALAREFNDAFGLTALCVTEYNPLSIRDSAILKRVYLPHAGDDENALVNGLIRLATKLRAEYEAKHGSLEGFPKLLLIANNDWRVKVLSDNREKLEQFYVLAVPPREIVDQLSDKREFARIAATVPGMLTPPTAYQDFSDADSPDWKPVELPEDIGFPLIAKPTVSSGYETLQFEGHKKVYLINSADELDNLWTTLRNAGYRGTFAVQKLIPGDDEYMHSVTAYVDQAGRVTMICHAHVLLEEHTPQLLGNPCAMITSPDEQLFSQVRAFLAACNYHGFANFDIKEDPRDGKMYFFEVNTRIGRNSFYNVGAGINPMEKLVADLIDNEAAPEEVGERTALYTLVPQSLLRKYLKDDADRNEADRLHRSSRFDPMANPRDGSFKRRLYHAVEALSQRRKFARYYPEPTETSF